MDCFEKLFNNDNYLFAIPRTRDIDEHVRRAAYKFLAEKVHIKSLTINQREGVLKRGLGDRNEAVKKMVEKEMIPAWLRLSNNNIVQVDINRVDIKRCLASLLCVSHCSIFKLSYKTREVL